VGGKEGMRFRYFYAALRKPEGRNGKGKPYAMKRQRPTRQCRSGRKGCAVGRPKKRKKYPPEKNQEGIFN